METGFGLWLSTARISSLTGPVMVIKSESPGGNPGGSRLIRGWQNPLFTYQATEVYHGNRGQAT